MYQNQIKACFSFEVYPDPVHLRPYPKVVYLLCNLQAEEGPGSELFNGVQAVLVERHTLQNEGLSEWPREVVITTKIPPSE